ncbi:MAG: hypothetical protein GXP27_11335, partial [Planctomycetes bacterium]|nr:hypothetical protein [Planctomycetota bacterium]
MRKRGRFRALLKRVTASLGALAAAALAWWITSFVGCTRTEMLVLTLSGYPACSGPQNLLAEEDAALLKRLDDRPRFQVQLSRQWPELTDWLRRAAGRNPVIVYVSAPILCLSATSGPEEPSGVFLLSPHFDYVQTADSNPDWAESLIPLDGLADGLRTLPPEQPKLVLLDVCYRGDDWRLGAIQNDLTDKLRQPFQGIANLAVICSCDAGEKSWRVSHIGPAGRPQSVFAYFVFRGLQGDADQSPRNGRVTAAELYDYVRRQTNNWVQENRDVRGQHPVLVSGPGNGDALAFTIARVRYGGAKSQRPLENQPAGS